MTKRRHPARANVRECAVCHGRIAEQRPVYLVAHRGGSIVGPYHAGCAERLVLLAKKALQPETGDSHPYGQMRLSDKELDGE